MNKLLNRALPAAVDTALAVGAGLVVTGAFAGVAHLAHDAMGSSIQELRDTDAETYLREVVTAMQPSKDVSELDQERFRVQFAEKVKETVVEAPFSPPASFSHHVGVLSVEELRPVLRSLALLAQPVDSDERYAGSSLSALEAIGAVLTDAGRSFTAQVFDVLEQENNLVGRSLNELRRLDRRERRRREQALAEVEYIASARKCTPAEAAAAWRTDSDLRAEAREATGGTGDDFVTQRSFDHAFFGLTDVELCRHDALFRLLRHFAVTLTRRKYQMAPVKDERLLAIGLSESDLRLRERRVLHVQDAFGSDLPCGYSGDTVTHVILKDYATATAASFAWVALRFVLGSRFRVLAPVLSMRSGTAKVMRDLRTAPSFSWDAACRTALMASVVPVAFAWLWHLPDFVHSEWPRQMWRHMPLPERWQEGHSLQSEALCSAWLRVLAGVPLCVMAPYTFVPYSLFSMAREKLLAREDLSRGAAEHVQLVAEVTSNSPEINQIYQNLGRLFPWFFGTNTAHDERWVDELREQGQPGVLEADRKQAAAKSAEALEALRARNDEDARYLLQQLQQLEQQQNAAVSTESPTESTQ
ncbi:MAG: hypothetical protein MHM6MM_004757 [Cercozoa sp. M6MM]